MAKKIPPKSGMSGAYNNRDEGRVSDQVAATLLIMPGQKWVEEFYHDLKDGTITKGAFVYTKDTPDGEEQVTYRIVGGEYATNLSGLALRLAMFLASHDKVLTSEEVYDDYNSEGE